MPKFKVHDVVRLKSGKVGKIIKIAPADDAQFVGNYELCYHVEIATDDTPAPAICLIVSMPIISSDDGPYAAELISRREEGL